MTIEWDAERIKMLRQFLPPDMPQAAFDLFVERCKSTKLDPFAQQICPVKRGGKWTIQVQIHGLRLIAQRTGRYTPGEKETKFVYDKQGFLVAATVYIRIYAMGTWTEFGETAMWSEFAQKTRDGNLIEIWETKGHVMLAKCSESLGLRRGFPEEMEGMYSLDEFPAVIDTKFVEVAEPPLPAISAAPAPVAVTEARKGVETVVAGYVEQDPEKQAGGTGKEALPPQMTAGGILKGKVATILTWLGMPKGKGKPERWTVNAWGHKLLRTFYKETGGLREWTELHAILLELQEAMEHAGWEGPTPEFLHMLEGRGFDIDNHDELMAGEFGDIACLDGAEIRSLIDFLKTGKKVAA